MLKRFTSALMAALLLGTLLAGAASARRPRACLMPGTPECCRAMRHKSRASAASAVPPCCVAPRPQSTPARTNFTFKSSPGAANLPRPCATQATTVPVVAQARAYSPPFQPSHSPPAYIQHLALLI